MVRKDIVQQLNRYAPPDDADLGALDLPLGLVDVCNTLNESFKDTELDKLDNDAPFQDRTGPPPWS